jgi:Antitoxin VbhA
MTEHQVQRNMRAVPRAIAQQRLESLSVPEETVADLKRVARGEIDTAEVIRNIHTRLSHAALLRQ